jgi:hypothetical protein
MLVPQRFSEAVLRTAAAGVLLGINFLRSQRHIQEGAS